MPCTICTAWWWLLALMVRECTPRGGDMPLVTGLSPLSYASNSISPDLEFYGAFGNITRRWAHTFAIKNAILHENLRRSLYMCTHWIKRMQSLSLASSVICDRKSKNILHRNEWAAWENCPHEIWKLWFHMLLYLVCLCAATHQQTVQHHLIRQCSANSVQHQLKCRTFTAQPEQQIHYERTCRGPHTCSCTTTSSQHNIHVQGKELLHSTTYLYMYSNFFTTPHTCTRTVTSAQHHIAAQQHLRNTTHSNTCKIPH